MRISFYTFLRRGNREGDAELFSLESSNLGHVGVIQSCARGGSELYSRRHFFTNKVIRPWKKLP